MLKKNWKSLAFLYKYIVNEYCKHQEKKIE